MLFSFLTQFMTSSSSAPPLSLEKFNEPSENQQYNEIQMKLLEARAEKVAELDEIVDSLVARFATILVTTMTTQVKLGEAEYTLEFNTWLTDAIHAKKMDIISGSFHHQPKYTFTNHLNVLDLRNSFWSNEQYYSFKKNAYSQALKRRLIASFDEEVRKHALRYGIKIKNAGTFKYEIDYAKKENH